VRQYIRQHDSNGLWSKYNIEYGFSRNLLGCRVLWLMIGVVSALFTVIYGWRIGTGILNPATAVEVGLAAAAAYGGWKFLPHAAKRIADGYASAAWIALLHSRESEADEKGPRQAVPGFGRAGDRRDAF
jgi:hypothetical protein